MDSLRSDALITRDQARNLWSIVQNVVVLGGTVLLVLLQVPWLGGVVEKLGFPDGTTLSTVLIPLVLTGLYLEVAEISRAIARGTPSRQLHSNPLEVYPVLEARAKEIRRPESKQLDVLGMTLYTAWPSVRFWISRHEFANWNVRLAAMVDREGALGSFIQSEWSQQSIDQLTDILGRSSSADLAANSVGLTGFEYDFMPVVHGFRLGNGDLFLSQLRWGADGKISFDGYTYEFIPGDDVSPAAEAARNLFDSWFQRATRTPFAGPGSPPVT